MAKRHKDALKRARQAETKNRRNKSIVAKVKTLRDKVLTAATPEAKAEALKKAVSAVAKAGARGTVHRRKASRMISRMSKAANKK